MVYTSYFGRVKYIKENYPNLTLCSISHNKPQWLDDSILD